MSAATGRTRIAVAGSGGRMGRMLIEAIHADADAQTQRFLAFRRRLRRERKRPLDHRERLVVEGRRDEPRLERARRQVDAGVEAGAEEAAEELGVGGQRCRHVAHRSWREKETEHGTSLGGLKRNSFGFGGTNASLVLKKVAG